MNITRNRQGEGYEIRNTAGEIIACGFDTYEEAEEWIANCKPELSLQRCQDT
jgi:hypothetical protein